MKASHNAHAQQAKGSVINNWHCYTNYESLILIKIPKLASKTSRLQEWHIPPSSHGFHSRPVTDLVVVKPPKPSTITSTVKRSAYQGTKSLLYNPVIIFTRWAFPERKVVAHSVIRQLGGPKFGQKVRTFLSANANIGKFPGDVCSLISTKLLTRQASWPWGASSPRDSHVGTIRGEHCMLTGATRPCGITWCVGGRVSRIWATYTKAKCMSWVTQAQKAAHHCFKVQISHWVMFKPDSTGQGPANKIPYKTATMEFGSENALLAGWFMTQLAGDSGDYLKLSAQQKIQLLIWISWEARKMAF